jgi:hypothetical protein
METKKPEWKVILLELIKEKNKEILNISKLTHDKCSKSWLSK